MREKKLKHEFPNLCVIEHPLIKHKLTHLRNEETGPDAFRRLVREMSYMLAYEVTRDLPTENITIRTPLAEIASPVISGKKQCSRLCACGPSDCGVKKWLQTARFRPDSDHFWHFSEHCLAQYPFAYATPLAQMHRQGQHETQQRG